MPPPPSVVRSLVRLTVSVVLLALLGAGAGLFSERRWLGPDVASTRAKVADDVRREFATMSARLTAVVQVVQDEAARVGLAAEGGPAELRTLFALVDRARGGPGGTTASLTVSGADAAPLAWGGRPSVLPLSQVVGPRAVFLAPGPLGLRLVLVEPLIDEGPRRVGAAVAEVNVPVEPSEVSGGAGSFILPTTIVPVRLQPWTDGMQVAAPDLITIEIPGRSAPLAMIDVPGAALAAARDGWRQRVRAFGVGASALLLLLLTGPLLTWRRRSPSPRTDLTLTLVVGAALVAARVVAGIAVEWFRGAGAASGAPLPRAVPGLIDGAPELLMTALTLGGLAALAASAFERWRKRAVRAGRLTGDASIGRLLAWHASAGAAVASVLAFYEYELRTRVPALDVDVLRFSLHPWGGERLLLALALIVLHATVIGLAVFLLRAAFVMAMPAARPGRRALVLGLWVTPALLTMGAAPTATDALPLVPGLLALAFVIAVAWTAGRYRLWLGRASQAQRLAGFFLALLLPSVVMYPSMSDAGGRARRQTIETRYAPDVMHQRRDLQAHVAAALVEIDRLRVVEELVAVAGPPAPGPVPSEAAFQVWSQTALAAQRLTSSIELFGPDGALLSRFALNLPDTSASLGWQEASCDWEIFEEVSPFFAEERRLLHAGRRVCDERGEGLGWIEVHAMLDYGNLPFISAQNPYVALLQPAATGAIDPGAHEEVEFTVYGWSRRPLYMSGDGAWPLSEDLFARIFASREPFWAVASRGDTAYDVYFLNDRGAIYALGHPRASALGHLMALAELVVLVAVAFAGLLAGGAVYALAGARTPTSARALLREVRASFYRKLYLAFVLAAVVPVLALAFVTRTYVAGLMRADVEAEALRTAAAASRVVEDFASLESQGAADVPGVDDDLIVWLSRVVAQDVNIYEGPRLLASSERNLFASGLLSTRTPGEIYQAVALEGRPSYVGQESVGAYSYLVAAAPVRIGGREAILSVPLTLRQREIERQIDELDRRVLLAVLAFVLIGAAIGYSMAERIADPVNRLMRATRRIAAGDLDADLPTTSRDELQRLVEAFNGMAAELRRQRQELERTNRLEAWADMARQVAHDIKNPLTPIQLNAEHLRRVHADRGRPLDPVLDDCVNTILAQVRLLRQIAAEFSSFASAPVARPVAAPLPALVDEVVEPYLSGLAGRIAVHVRMHEPLRPVFVDRTLIGRALANVIENALHAMPGTGRLEIDAGPVSSGYVPLVVRDTGIGMDAEEIARIFEPYFSTKATGTGLGLTIARRNVELNGGSIGVESAPGQGATVTMRLPVAEGPPEA